LNAPKSEDFRPFETNLARETALKTLQDATNGADDGELFLERKRAEMLSFDDGRLKTASYDASEGFGLRAVKGETAAYAHSTEISEHALRRAAETTKLAVGDGGGIMAPAPKPTNQHLYTDVNPMGGQTFSGAAKAAAPVVADVTASTVFLSPATGKA